MKWQHMTMGMRVTYSRPIRAPRSERKRALRTQHEFLAECLMVLSIAALEQDIVEELAEYAGVPVWNGLDK